MLFMPLLLQLHQLPYQMPAHLLQQLQHQFPLLLLPYHLSLPLPLPHLHPCPLPPHCWHQQVQYMHPLLGSSLWQHPLRCPLPQLVPLWQAPAQSLVPLLRPRHQIILLLLLVSAHTAQLKCNKCSCHMSWCDMSLFHLRHSDNCWIS